MKFVDIDIIYDFYRSAKTNWTIKYWSCKFHDSLLNPMKRRRKLYDLSDEGFIKWMNDDFLGRNALSV